MIIWNNLNMNQFSPEPEKNPEVARTEVAGQNRQKMNIAKNHQMRRG